jgi:hypothetical protein
MSIGGKKRNDASARRLSCSAQLLLLLERDNFDYSFLCLGGDFERAGRQLQHGGVLASGQFRHHNDLAVRQFQAIMVDVALLLIDLPEPGNLMREPLVAEAIGAFAFHILCKGKLRPGEEANGNMWLASGSETSSARVEEAGGD